MTIDDTLALLGQGALRVVVVGQGYVGLSVASAAALAGMTVVGIDTDVERIAGLARRTLVVPGVDERNFLAAADSGRLTFATRADAVATADVVLIAVATPVVEHRPDLSAIEAAGAAVGTKLRRGTLVVLESTTYPGTTEQVLRPLLEAGGLVAGEDFWLAYSPERIDPGSDKFGFRDIPRVVGGLDASASAVAAAFYARLVDHVQVVSSCRAAEMAKLLENTFRMVNIALVNELAMLCHDQAISAWEVIDAAATKPFGFMPFYPGPGVGGHCIPIDPTYLSWQSRRDAGRPYRLVELAQDINTEMPAHVVDRITEILNEIGKAVNGSRIVVLGVTYKPDVGDVRESAALRVVERLIRKGANVAFHDPFITALDDLQLARAELSDELLRSADLVAVLTPHSSYDLDHVVAVAPLLFDARNALRGVAGDRVRSL